MRTHRLLAFVAVLLLTSSLGVWAKQPPSGCILKELQATDFPLDQLDPEAAGTVARALGVAPDQVRIHRLALEPESRSTQFRGSPEELVNVRAVMDLDATPFLEYAREMAASKAVSSCHLNVAPHAPRMSAANGDLHVIVPTTVEWNICGSFTTICCKRFKCYKCQTGFRTKLFQKTVDVNLVLHPETEPKPDLSPHASISGISGWENEVRKALDQVLEIFTTKADNEAFGLGSIASGEWLATLRSSIPALVHLSGGDDQVSDFEKQLILDNLRFDETDGKVVFRVTKRRELRRSAYCPIQNQVRETIAFLDSFRQPAKCISITAGESFWAIADRHYANGECGLALAQLHRQRTGTRGLLQPGDQVLVPPMHRLLIPEQGTAIVGKHESRTIIAAGADASVEQTFLEERDRENPNLIYPCQYVSVGAKDLQALAVEATCPISTSDSTR